MYMCVAFVYVFKCKSLKYVGECDLQLMVYTLPTSIACAKCCSTIHAHVVNPFVYDWNLHSPNQTSQHHWNSSNKTRKCILHSHICEISIETHSLFSTLCWMGCVCVWENVMYVALIWMHIIGYGCAVQRLPTRFAMQGHFSYYCHNRRGSAVCARYYMGKKKGRLCVWTHNCKVINIW